MKDPPNIRLSAVELWIEKNENSISKEANFRNMNPTELLIQMMEDALQAYVAGRNDNDAVVDSN